MLPNRYFKNPNHFWVSFSLLCWETFTREWKIYEWSVEIHLLVSPLSLPAISPSATSRECPSPSKDKGWDCTRLENPSLILSCLLQAWRLRKINTCGTQVTHMPDEERGKSLLATCITATLVFFTAVLQQFPNPGNLIFPPVWVV